MIPKVSLLIITQFILLFKIFVYTVNNYICVNTVLYHISESNKNPVSEKFKSYTNEKCPKK